LVNGRLDLGQTGPKRLAATPAGNVKSSTLASDPKPPPYRPEYQDEQ
jgi:hypothetical protein